MLNTHLLSLSVCLSLSLSLSLSLADSPLHPSSSIHHFQHQHVKAWPRYVHICMCTGTLGYVIPASYAIAPWTRRIEYQRSYGFSLQHLSTYGHIRKNISHSNSTCPPIFHLTTANLAVHAPGAMYVRKYVRSKSWVDPTKMSLIESK